MTPSSAETANERWRRVKTSCHCVFAFNKICFDMDIDKIKWICCVFCKFYHCTPSEWMMTGENGSDWWWVACANHSLLYFMTHSNSSELEKWLIQLQKRANDTWNRGWSSCFYWSFMMDFDLVFRNLDSDGVVWTYLFKVNRIKVKKNEFVGNKAILRAIPGVKIFDEFSEV